MGGKQSQNPWRGHDLKRDELESYYRNSKTNQASLKDTLGAGVNTQQLKEVKQDASVCAAVMNTHCVVIRAEDCPAVRRAGANNMIL